MKKIICLAVLVFLLTACFSNVSKDYKQFGLENDENILGAVIDYGYEGYNKDEAKYKFSEELETFGKNSQNFAIIPKYKDSEIIINEIIIVDNDLATGDEIYRTTKPFILVTELPEGAPNMEVIIKHDDKSVVWTPFFNGRDGTLILPEGLIEVKE